MTKITNFGVFVELEQDLEGLLHVSELSDEKISDPHDVVQLEQEIEVKILRVDAADRKIGLSKKRADWAADSTAPPGESGAELSARKQRRGGLHGAGEATTDIISGTALLHKDGAADKTANESSEPEGKTAEENTPGEKTAEDDDNPAEEQVAGDEEKTAEA